MPYKHKQKSLDNMLSHKDLEMAAACHFNDLIAHLSYFNSKDDEFFGILAETLNKFIVLGLMVRFRNEGEFEERLRSYLEITASDEMMALVMDMFRTAATERGAQ